MLPTSTAFKTAARNQSVGAHGRAYVYKSKNNLVENVTVTDAIGTAVRQDFGVENVIRARQPRSGSAYALMGTAFIESTDTHTSRNFRFAPSELDEGNYVYYISDQVTAGVNGVGPVADIVVDYGTAQPMNHVEVSFENTYRHNDYHRISLEVQVGQPGSWTTISNALITDSSGKLKLWFNGSLWSTTRPANPVVTQQRAIRVIVKDTRDHPWQVSVLSIDAFEVVELNDSIVSINTSRTSGAQSTYLPFEQAQTNTATVQIDDKDLSFLITDASNAEESLIDTKVEIQFGIETVFGDPQSIEWITGFSGYSVDVSYSTDDLVVSLELEDTARYMQEDFADDALWEGKSIKYIICDILGRTGYPFLDATFIGSEYNRVMNYAWTTSDTSVFDVLSEITQSIGGTFFVDEDSSLTFVDYSFLDATSITGPVTTIDATSDLESASRRFEVSANHVTTNYRTYGKNIDTLGTAQTRAYIENGRLLSETTYSGPTEIASALWEPGDVVALGSAALIEFDDVNGKIAIDFSQGEIFPEQGELFLNNEYISYDTKTVVLKTDPSPYTDFKGPVDAVVLGIKERGLRGTNPNTIHLTATEKLEDFVLNKEYFWIGSDKPVVGTSIVDGGLNVESSVKDRPRDSMVLYYTTLDDTRYLAYGAELVIKPTSRSTKNDGVAGLFMQVNPSTYTSNRFRLEGIFVEIGSLANVDDSNFTEATVRAYKLTNNHNINQRAPLPPTNEGVVGFQNIRLALNTPIRLDVLYKDSTDTYIVYINGLSVMSFRTEYTPAQVQVENNEGLKEANFTAFDIYQTTLSNGYSGWFVRGNTNVQFNYFYRGNDFKTVPSTPGIINPSTNQIASYTTYFPAGQGEFEEFGSIAHEVKSFDVNHQVFPNRTASIFMTNVGEARIVEQSHNSFRSRFTLQNTSRRSAILNGSDNDTVIGQSINHSFFVSGFTIVEKSSGQETVTDSSSIRRYGKEEVELDFMWGQSKEQAQSISQAIVDRWSKPNDFFDIEYFPVPSLQVGDEVTIDYQELGFGRPGDRYFIKSINLDYDGGLTASSTVQRYQPVLS